MTWSFEDGHTKIYFGLRQYFNVLIILLYLEKVLIDLVIGDDLAFVLQNENLIDNKLNIMVLIEILGAIGRYDLAKELSNFLARGQYIIRLCQELQ